MCCLAAVCVFLGPRAAGLDLVARSIPPSGAPRSRTTSSASSAGCSCRGRPSPGCSSHSGGITGLDVGLIIVGIFADFATYGGNAYKRKDLGFNY